MNAFLDNPDLVRELERMVLPGFAGSADIYQKTLEILGGISDSLAENAAKADESESLRPEYSKATKQSLELLKKTGTFGMTIPVEYGGLGFPVSVFMASLEIISRADAGLGALWSLQACSETILEFGDDTLKNKWLPILAENGSAAMALTEPDAGSDLQSVSLKASPDVENPGLWRLNGVKRFITGGNARMVLVLARSEDGSSDGRGLSLFVYDSRDGHMSMRRTENKMGIRSSVTVEMCFENAPARLVGSTRMGLIRYVMSLMNGARLAVAAQSVGIAEAAWREALNYASLRKQFGVPVASFPQVDLLLRGIRGRLKAARALLYETARLVDIAKLNTNNRLEYKKYRALADAFTPLVKLAASEFAVRAASDAVQVHGGSGYMKGSRVERLYRDARVTSIYEGTSQMQVIAAMSALQKGLYKEQLAVYDSGRGRVHDLFVSYLEITETALSREECRDYLAPVLIWMTAYVAMSLLLEKKYGAVDDDFVLEAEQYMASGRVFAENFSVSPGN